MADIKFLVVVDSTKGTVAIKQLDKDITGLGKSSQKATPGIAGMWKQMAAGMATIYGVVRAFRVFTNFISDSVQKAAEQEAVIRQLEARLRSTGECKFRPNPVNDSDLFRSLNPEHSGHRFRFIPATFCRVPEFGTKEATLDNLNRISHHVPSEKERRTRWQKRGYPCEKSEKYSG